MPENLQAIRQNCDWYFLVILSNNSNWWKIDATVGEEWQNVNTIDYSEIITYSTLIAEELISSRVVKRWKILQQNISKRKNWKYFQQQCCAHFRIRAILMLSVLLSFSFYFLNHLHEHLCFCLRAASLTSDIKMFTCK